MRKSGNKINPFRQAKKKKVKETGKKRNKRKRATSQFFWNYFRRLQGGIEVKKERKEGTKYLKNK